ncbi:MAG: hypothetical protein HZB46_01505, partial [Solirubrobacterales bacterium]|nr:hypothetical protein [Solirubrobacterales bacterium]
MRLHRLLLLPLLLLAASLTGCIGISSTSTTQPQSMGPVRLTVNACATGSPGCTATSNTGSAYGFLDSTGSNDVLKAQALLAVRLPDGAVPPPLITAGALAFARSDSYEAELEALEPAPAGERWWGWRSGSFDYSRLTAQGFSATFDVTVPRPADGGPYPSPMRWRPVVGARFVDPAASLPAARPVECGTAPEDLYDGFNESGGGQPTTVCVDDPTPDGTRGFLTAPLVDFGVVGTTVQAPAGSTVTATFLAKRSGAPAPGTTFALAVDGGPPGGTVALDRSSVSLGGDSATPVLATVTVPAGTAPGEYPL